MFDERAGRSRTELWALVHSSDELAQLSAQGYDVIPYINGTEAPGSLSYLILDPASVTVGSSTRVRKVGESFAERGASRRNLEVVEAPAGGVARETGETVAARTDAEARAVIKSLEEKAAPAASGVVDKPMWHGSSQRFDTFSAGHGDERALFGLGVYTTDDMSVAAGYSRKKTRPQNRPLGGTPGSEPRERLIYNVVWRGENPPRVLDLEATMPDEVRGIARSVADSLDHPWVTDELPYVALDSELTVLDELVSIVDDPASTFEDFYRKLVRVFAESGQPSTEFVDILQKMSGDLVEAGVDAFRYTGGKRGKGRLHEAMVWLDSESVEIVQAGNIEGLLRNTGG
jgi:hypothetical protein